MFNFGEDSGTIKSKDKEIERLERQVRDLESDLSMKDRQHASELDIAVKEKTKALSEEVQRLTIANESNKKEVAILTKAFENLGFDVKDMKDILNKLVDGIVGKNKVQVIK